MGGSGVRGTAIANTRLLGPTPKLLLAAAVAAVAVAVAVAVYLARGRRAAPGGGPSVERFHGGLNDPGATAADRYACVFPGSGAAVPTDALVMHMDSSSADPMCVLVRGADGLLTADDGLTCEAVADAPDWGGDSSKDVMNPLRNSPLVRSIESQVFQGQPRCVLTFAKPDATAAEAAKLAADMTLAGSQFRAGVPAMHAHYEPIIIGLQRDIAALDKHTAALKQQAADARTKTATMRAQMYGPGQQFDSAGKPTAPDPPTGGLFRDVADRNASTQKCNDDIATNVAKQTSLGSQLGDCKDQTTQAAVSGAASDNVTYNFLLRALKQGSYDNASPGCIVGKSKYMQESAPQLTTDAWTDWLMNGQATGRWPGTKKCYTPQTQYKCPSWTPVVEVGPPETAPWNVSGFVDPDARWISPVKGDSADATSSVFGYVFENHNTVDAVEATLWCAIDNYGTVYLNGAVVGTILGTDKPSWKAPLSWPVVLIPGLNAVTVEVGNVDTTPTGVLLSVMTPGGALFHTDSTWFTQPGPAILADDSPPPPPQAPLVLRKDMLDSAGIAAPSQLVPGGSIASKQGFYALSMQPDGNAVVYRNDAAVIWASGTWDKAVGRIVLQDDGNLVLYNPWNGPIWATNSAQSGGGPFSLVMQDDGNLVIYNAANRRTWSSW